MAETSATSALLPRRKEEGDTPQTDADSVNVAEPTDNRTALQVILELFPVIYLPSMCFGLADGLAQAFLPLFVRSLGCKIHLVGVVVSMKPLGKLAGDVPAGTLYRQLGCRQTMLLGLFGASCASFLSFFATSWLVLALAYFLTGMMEALFTVSRSSFMRGAVQGRHRGRCVSLLGGVNRMTRVVGPAMGGLFAAHGGVAAPFLARAIMCLVAVLAVAARMPHVDVAAKTEGAHNVIATFRAHWRVYVTVALSCSLLNFIRSSRNILVPLQGRALQLSNMQIGFCVSLGYVFDTALFAPAGYIMDKYGRKMAGMLAFFILSVSLILLPLAVTEPRLHVVAAVLGLGNGLSSGLNMVVRSRTLGGDVAPPAPETGEFLGVYQLINDSGQFLGPLCVGAIANAYTLGASSVVSGLVGLLGLAWFGCTVKETLQR